MSCIMMGITGFGGKQEACLFAGSTESHRLSRASDQEEEGGMFLIRRLGSVGGQAPSG